MYLTYADHFRPASRLAGRLYDLGLIVAGSLLIALSAQLSVHLPFSPVPITGQTFAVLFLGFLLGPWRGGAAALAYLAEGATGLPVFAGAMGGPAVLLGPTAGYLYGFVPAAFLAGWLAQRGWDRSPWRTALAMAAGNSAIYLLGLPWLSHFVGDSQVLALGLFPFIPGDLFKIALAVPLLPLGWRWLGKCPRSLR